MFRSFTTAFGLVAGALAGIWVSDKVIKSIDNGHFGDDVKKTVNKAKDFVLGDGEEAGA